MRRKAFKKCKKGLVMGLSAALALGSVAFGGLPGATIVAKAADCDLSENFDNYSDTDELMGYTFGEPTLTIVDSGVGESKALLVSNRTQNYFGYAYNVSKYRGNTIIVSFDATAPDLEDAASAPVNATLKISSIDGDDYQTAATGEVTNDGFTTISGTYDVPADCDSVAMYFESDADVSYVIDNISITVDGEYVDPSTNVSYVDFSEYPILKDLYNDYFKLGVSCEAISRPNGDNPDLREIGNETKEAFMAQEFSTLTFANELKPENNMAWDSENATETYLPFELCSSAKEMLDWCKANNMPIRGHVLVWHSQCPDEAFCKDYTIVKTNNRLDPSCFVTRETMLARMESYIDSAMKCMYENGYADIIYAWDVVNEAFEPSDNQDGLLRNSYWYQVIGPDYIYYAFKYARAAVDKYSQQYASLYGVDPSDEAALATIQPKLFYNDYNEFQANKRDAIISYFTDDTISGHNIVKEGLIDGMGMQAHLADNTDIDQFVTAMRMYDEAFGEVHVTELDISQTTTGVNAEHYQGVYYNSLFKAFIDEVENGVNLTSVTIWGLTDDNSWKKETRPLILNRDLSRKIAFDGIVNAVTGEKMPEPVFIKPDLSDMYCDFEGDYFPVNGRSATVKVQSDEAYEGSNAVLCTGRTANWNGISFDVSRFAGQTIEIQAMIKTEDAEVKLSADIDGVWPNITTVKSNGEWMEVSGVYSIPKNLSGLSLYFETDDVADIYLDNLSVTLVGLDEGFEESTNIASPRGDGHMPVVTVTAEEKKSGEKALKVTRAEKDATVSLDISKYIGMDVIVSAYVKTEDANISMGIDYGNATVMSKAETVAGEWTPVSFETSIPDDVKSVKVFIETDGNADMYIDDFTVRPKKEDPISGWVQSEDGTSWYYYKQGEAVTGWLADGSKWYYLAEDGKMVTGWQKIDNKWYYFTPGGAMVTGWKAINNKWYYFTPGGAMVTGWKAINNKWYYFTPGGAMVSGWKEINSKWYYFTPGGAMVSGWQQINSKWYYFTSSGVMVSGWQQINNKWYYFTSGGAMVTGWKQINNKWYYFETSGVMATSKWINGTYYVKSSGVMAVNEWVDGGKYYVDAKGKYVPGKKK